LIKTERRSPSFSNLIDFFSTPKNEVINGRSATKGPPAWPLAIATTVIASERTGRHCYGLELDPLYADTIVRRWQSFTGDSARHAASGRTFNDLKAETKGT
jgi:hypothetical protein